MTILFDSGIRTGADVFKALALGAHAVMVGRLYVWGMAHEGESGCRHVMKSLLAVSHFRVSSPVLYLILSIFGHTGLGHIDDRRRVSVDHARRGSQGAEVESARRSAGEGRPREVVDDCTLYTRTFRRR